MKDYLIGSKYYTVGWSIVKNIGKTQFFTLFDIRIPKTYNHVHGVFVWRPVVNDTGLIINRIDSKRGYYNFIVSFFLFRLSFILEVSYGK